jgi:importin subunit alpha-6/7
MEAKRKDGFKKAVTTDDGRRRRGETAVQLRKQQREEGLAKRRNVMVNNFVSEENDTPVAMPTANEYTALLMKLQSNDITLQTEGLRGFRKLLSIEVNPPVQQCIDIGAVPYFVHFLQRNDCDILQFEAAWALTNIASTDRTSVVVECGAIPFLVQQLVSPSADVREQCAWCLGNVAGEGASFRDIILGEGGLAPLLQNILMPANISLLRNCVWTLSNFCRGKPQPSLEVIEAAYEPLVNLLKSSTDQATVIDACWALSYLSDGSNSRIQKLVNLDPCYTLVNMLQSGQHQIIIPALRTLGNIVSGEDHQTQSVVDAGGLTAVVPLLTNAKKNIRKEACWMISNIAAGSKSQLAAVVNTPELVVRVLNLMSEGTEWDVRKEAAWVISNIATGGSKHHVQTLVEQGAIPPVCDLLDSSDAKDVKVTIIALEALESILNHTVNNSYKIDTRHLIDEAGGLSKLEALQEHKVDEVYEKALKIVEKFFGGEDEEESENLAPAVHSNQMNTFGFGLSQEKSGVQKGFNFSFNGAAAASTGAPNTLNRNLFA